jgi:regulator of protease activity HflC (stomatin/prohibitin superfamily)
MATNTQDVNSLVSIIVIVGLLIAFAGPIFNALGLLGILAMIAAAAFLLVLAGLRVVNQYERGIILTLGKYSETRNPGLTWVLIVFQKMIKVDMRIDTIDIPKQEVITKDNVPAGINAVVYFQVKSADKAILNIQDYKLGVTQYAQAALRDVVGGVELDSLLSEREKISDETKKITDEATINWGVDVIDIKIQDIELPADMKRVMAKQAESERERRAVIIRAEGEFQAAQKLSQAATVLASTPGGISMRTLQTIEKLNPDPSKTVIFALPVEILEGFKNLAGNSGNSNK